MRPLALHRLAPAAALGAVAVASLALKMAIVPEGREQIIVHNLDRATAGATALLERHGFSVSKRGTRDSPITRASNGACALTIVFGDPRGFHRATVDRLMSGTDRQQTFYAGRAYDELPVNRSWLSYYRWVTLAEIGYIGSYPLVEHVIIRPGCDARSALFSELRRLTAPRS